MRPSVFRLLSFHVTESKGFLSLSLFFFSVCLFVRLIIPEKKGGKLATEANSIPFVFFFSFFSINLSIGRFEVYFRSFRLFFFFFFYEGFVEFLKCESE